MNFAETVPLEMTDHYFINTAYLSELWAAQDIEEKIGAGLISKKEAQDQVDDEFRHAEMLRKMMLRFGFKPCDDVAYAMQNILYKSICELDLKKVEGDVLYFWGIHEVMETRAIWNYKSYTRGGRLEEYKKVLRIIVQDERSHFKSVDLSYPATKKVYDADRWLHRVYLYEKYNKMNLIQCPNFWTRYFSDAVGS